MKTRNILLVLALMSNIAATAQEVTVLHMKDGTTRRFTNGCKETTQIGFFEYATLDNIEHNSTTTQHNNGFSYDWDATKVWHVDGSYCVAVVWEDNMPASSQARYGMLFGTQPGLTVEYNDSIEYFTGLKGSLYINSQTVNKANYPGLHYFLIGQPMLGSEAMEWNTTDGSNFRLILNDNTSDNHITATLVPGQTYYYRTFAEGQMEEGGEVKPTVFYGEEKCFRVPRVMADAGYYSYIRGTDEAVAAFATHFPETFTANDMEFQVTSPTWEKMEPLWNLWRASEEGRQVDIMAYVTTEAFEDGTGYRLNHIPDEFYIWLARREVVIDAFDGLAEISEIWNSSTGEDEPIATAESIGNVDASWGVPGGKYIRFEPTKPANNAVIYKSDDVLPGLKYKLVIYLAPETEMENTEENKKYFLPTKVRVSDVANSNTVITDFEVSATEVTTLEVEDFRTTEMGLELKIETHVSSSELRKGMYNRILRIAEMHLIPVLDE